MPNRYKPELAIKRFWAYAVKVKSGCLIWQASTTGATPLVGLCGLSKAHGTRSARRLALLLSGVTIPDGWVVVPCPQHNLCINPKHVVCRDALPKTKRKREERKKLSICV